MKKQQISRPAPSDYTIREKEMSGKNSSFLAGVLFGLLVGVALTCCITVVPWRPGRELRQDDIVVSDIGKRPSPGTEALREDIMRLFEANKSLKVEDFWNDLKKKLHTSEAQEAGSSERHFSDWERMHKDVTAKGHLYLPVVLTLILEQPDVPQEGDLEVCTFLCWLLSRLQRTEEAHVFKKLSLWAASSKDDFFSSVCFGALFALAYPGPFDEAFASHLIPTVVSAFNGTSMGPLTRSQIVTSLARVRDSRFIPIFQKAASSRESREFLSAIRGIQAIAALHDRESIRALLILRTAPGLHSGLLAVIEKELTRLLPEQVKLPLRDENATNQWIDTVLPTLSWSESEKRYVVKSR